MSPVPASGTGAPALRVAQLGCGTVGAAVARLLLERADLLADRAGRRLGLTGIAVRDLSRQRSASEVPTGLLTDDAASLVDGADLVVEVMGGLEPAGTLVARALQRGASVVTANKQLIAHHGPRLHELADAHGASLDYEGAVVAGVPVLRVVREALAGDEIESIAGIMNGSTNLVLDMVARGDTTFEDAVVRAGRLGFLEADPAEDLEGLDAAAKILILARAAWGCDVGLDDVQRQGITGLTDDDFEVARGTDQVIKLIASAWRSGSGAHARYEMAVQPVPLAHDHPLAGVRDGHNAILLETTSAGPLRLYGTGAGGEETASAILGDLVTAARRIAATTR